MESEATSIELLFEKAEQYGKTTAELYKLKAIGKTADVASSLITSLTVIIFIGLFILISSIGISLWVGELLGKSYYGFFIVSGFYLITGFFLYLFRHQWIKMPVNDSIIAQALK